MTIKKPLYAVVLALVFWLPGCGTAWVLGFGRGPLLVEMAWAGDTDGVAALLRAGADVNAATPPLAQQRSTGPSTEAMRPWYGFC